jgi:hypothetical protein
MISRAQIKELAEQLKELIGKREKKLKCTLDIFNSWKDMDEFLNGLRSAIKKMHIVIANEQKELQNMKDKLRELILIKEIDTNNPNSEQSLISYVKSQSIVTEPLSLLEEPIENINSYFEKMQKFLNNKLSHKWLATKDSYFKEQGSEASPHHNEQTKRQAATECKYNSKAFTEALALLAGEKNNCASIKNYCPYKENTCKDKHLLDWRLNDKESKGIMRNIHGSEEKCNSCKEYTKQLLRLTCCGHICISCLKKKIVEREPKVILNTFEAEKKQVSMFVCPSHKVPLSIEIIKEIFGTKELERMSIEAMKRQKKISGSRRVKQPTLCSDCKAVMRDDTKAVKVCSKHKICKNCVT